jgi:hypothetical protein
LSDKTIVAVLTIESTCSIPHFEKWEARVKLAAGVSSCHRNLAGAMALSELATRALRWKFISTEISFLEACCCP